MNNRSRLIWIVLLLLLLASAGAARFSDRWATNRAMAQLNHCLLPIGWISYPDRARSVSPDQPVPPSACLEAARHESGASRSVLSRLELIAGDIAASRDLWQDAIMHYRNAAELIDHPAPGIWSAVVGIYMGKLKDYETALTIALQALRSSPEDQALRMSAGMLYLYYVPPYSNYAQAIAVMRPELGFTEPHFYNIAAGSYLALGELDNGLRMAQESVRLSRARNDINLATGLYLLGLMQRCTGQSELGIANLREAQGLSPQDENIKAALSEDVTSLCKSYGKSR